MISKRDSSEILKFGRCKITKSLGKDKVSFPFFVALCTYVREREFYRTAIVPNDKQTVTNSFLNSERITI